MNKTEKRKIGDIGEDIACEFLKKKGDKIIERNFRQKFGEIDIIAKEKNGTLIFIEVKTMKSINPAIGIIPEDQMSSAKIRKTKRICEAFANANKKLVDEERGWRIDLIAITLSGLTDKNESCDIKQYENI